MGRIGWAELLVILVIVLIVFGGAKLSGLGRTLGKTIKDFKKEIKDDDGEGQSHNEDTNTEEKH